MARPRSFDMEEVLDRAMALFWRRGYAETALSEIYAATGLKPGSLYGAVSGKEELFRLAFERYVAHFRATLPAGVEGLPAIAAWLETQRRLAIADPERRGCLIVNTALEREQHSRAVRMMAKARLKEIRGFFLHHLGVARARGEIGPWIEPEHQADALLGTVVAIMSLARAGAEPGQVAHVAQAALAALGQPPLESGGRMV